MRIFLYLLNNSTISLILN